MINKLKKYLVVGRYTNNPTPQYHDGIYQLAGPFAEEVWADSETMAENEWVRKVIPHGIYATKLDIEVKEL